MATWWQRVLGRGGESADELELRLELRRVGEASARPDDRAFPERNDLHDLG